MFQKGQSGNPNGRPKGAQNGELRRIRLWIDKFLDDNTELFQSDLMALESEERLRIILGLMEYSVPKLQRTELQAEMDHNLSGGIPVIDWVKKDDGSTTE